MANDEPDLTQTMRYRKMTEYSLSEKNERYLPCQTGGNGIQDHVEGLQKLSRTLEDYFALPTITMPHYQRGGKK
jgi:hypothetical protein